MGETDNTSHDELSATIDGQQPNWHDMSPEARTSWFISEMLSRLTSEQSYEGAMNGVLEMMSGIIHTDRMSIFECGGDQTKITFERCDEGVPSLLGMVFDLPRWAINKWFSAAGDVPVALVPDTAVLERFSKPLYEWCRESGIRSLMAAPFYNNGEIVGFLGAYNSHIDETIDLNRLFAAVSSFIGARIENRQLIDNLAWASEHDALTNLYDRRGFEAAIAKLFEERPDVSCVLALIDLDDFKRINDVYGHAAGDEALKAVAHTMKRVFPDDAILCRNGGDEFLAVLFGDSAEQAESHIRRFTQDPLEFEYKSERHQMTSSIGYALYPEHATNADELYSKADAALYSIKLAGKAGYGKYTPEAEAHYRSQLGFTARDIVENVPYSMVVHKVESGGGILFCSSKFSRLFGCENMYELIKLTGGSLASLVHPDDRQRVAEHFSQLAANHNTEAAVIDFLALMPDGTGKALRVTSHLVNIAERGEVVFSLAVPVEE